MGGFTTLKFCERFGEQYAGRLKGIVLLDSSGVDVLGGMFMGNLVRLFYPGKGPAGATSRSRGR